MGFTVLLASKSFLRQNFDKGRASVTHFPAIPVIHPLCIVAQFIVTSVDIGHSYFGFTTPSFWAFTRVFVPNAGVCLGAFGRRRRLGSFALGVVDLVVAVVTSVEVSHLCFRFTTRSRTCARFLLPLRAGLCLGASARRRGLAFFALGAVDLVIAIIDTSVGVIHLRFGLAACSRAFTRFLLPRTGLSLGATSSVSRGGFGRCALGVVDGAFSTVTNAIA